MSNVSVLTCFHCGGKTDLQMYSQRKAGCIVGWIFICTKCETPDKVKTSVYKKERRRNE